MQTRPSKKYINDLPGRIRSKIQIAESGCWLWTGAKSSTGYGNVWWNKRYMQAHRAVYSLLVGPVTAETLDHLCRVPLCVNPRHLEPCSLRDNIRRGVHRNTKKTHCIHGHRLAGANLYVYTYGAKTMRQCKTCTLSRNHRSRLSLARAICLSSS